MATSIETYNLPASSSGTVVEKVDTVKRLAGTVHIPLFALVVGMACSIVNTEIKGMSAMTRTLQHMIDKSGEFTNTLQAALTGDKSAVPTSMSISSSSSQADLVAFQAQLQMKGSYINGVAFISRIMKPMEATQVIK